jgi:hypothetical protein
MLDVETFRKKLQDVLEARLRKIAHQTEEERTDDASEGWWFGALKQIGALMEIAYNDNIVAVRERYAGSYDVYFVRIGGSNRHQIWRINIEKDGRVWGDRRVSIKSASLEMLDPMSPEQAWALIH